MSTESGQAHLSQSELTFLIGDEQRSAVSSLELGTRVPRLRTLLALEVVLENPIHQLFTGSADDDVCDGVMARARTLLESLDDSPVPKLGVKFGLLSRLVRPDDYYVIPICEGEE